jgi:tRNA (guanine10-N2)-dimethyltransferase
MYYSVEPEGMAVADARHLPIDEVDCVVTDPPYGRSSTTLGSNTKKIVEDFFSAIEDTLPSEKRMCIASPKAIGIGILGGEHGFTPTQSHYVYVHRSLTREITVFKRV